MFIELLHQASFIPQRPWLQCIIYILSSPLFLPHSPQYYYLGSTTTKTQVQQAPDPVAEINYKAMLSPISQNIITLILES